MKKFGFILMIFALILSTAFTSTPALAAPKIDTELKSAVEALVGPGMAKGAVLSIVQDGRFACTSGFGYADEYNGIAADGVKTAFRIGSVSKNFVSVAALILDDKGLLNMHRDIADYLEPDFPKLKYPVTMHQLLTHTAGFEDMVTGMAVKNVSDTEPLSESVRKYLPKQVFKPGKVTSYSNYGIALAGYVVQRISGQDFAQFCREQIFLPLGMKRTTFEHMHDVAYVSKPYLPDGRETLEPYMNLYPEGSAVSTAEDMGKFMLWLMDSNDTRVLSAASKEELFKNQFTMSEDLPGVGYIWNRKARNNAVYYDKKGETLHFYSRIALYPEQKTGVFLSFNTYLPESKINAVMQKATALLYGETPSPKAGFGKSTLDIRGTYVNHWSSFTTPEKILRYIVTGKMLHITGSKEKGFLIDGQKMVLVGTDIYSTPMGILKFIKKDNKIMVAAESAITYSKVPFWQSSLMQAAVIALYAILVMVCLLRELIRLLRRSKKHNPVLLASSLVQMLAFGLLCFLMLKGIFAYSLLSFAPYLKLCSGLILVAWAMGLVNSLKTFKKDGSLSLITLSYEFSGFVFFLWMLWMNLF